MTTLRHEEFTEGCAAACNGPYDGKWSKTMIGYGQEDTHFVLELTYNYSVRSYDLGNDYNSITIRKKSVFENVKSKVCAHGCTIHAWALVRLLHECTKTACDTWTAHHRQMAECIYSWH